MVRPGYRRLQSTQYEDTGFTAEQFKKPPTKVPWKAIIFAAALFIGGSLLLTFGALLMTGAIAGRPNDSYATMIILGSLMFIPGSYHTYIAYQAYYRRPGYSFDDIPNILDDS